MASDAGFRSTALPATLTLWRRDVVRFIRQRSRIIGALGTPVVFWLLIGTGLGRSFSAPGSARQVDFLEYFFPGTLVMIILFSAIFSTISVIEDRREGFLQAVLVSPAPRSSIVLGKILGGTTLAWAQAMLFCLFAPLLGFELTAPGVIGLAPSSSSSRLPSPVWVSWSPGRWSPRRASTRS
jgi:ABC-2 type transport system permease protein